MSNDQTTGRRRGRPVGSKDSKPRAFQNPPPAIPVIVNAAEQGRTVPIRVAGSITPAAYARLSKEGGSLAEKVDKCIRRLIEIEQG